MRKEQPERPVLGLDTKYYEILVNRLCGMFLANYIFLFLFKFHVIDWLLLSYL